MSPIFESPIQSSQSFEATSPPDEYERLEKEFNEYREEMESKLRSMQRSKSREHEGAEEVRLQFAEYREDMEQQLESVKDSERKLQSALNLITAVVQSKTRQNEELRSELKELKLSQIQRSDGGNTSASTSGSDVETQESRISIAVNGVGVTLNGSRSTKSSRHIDWYHENCVSQSEYDKLLRDFNEFKEQSARRLQGMVSMERGLETNHRNDVIDSNGDRERDRNLNRNRSLSPRRPVRPQWSDNEDHGQYEKYTMRLERSQSLKLLRRSSTSVQSAQSAQSYISTEGTETAGADQFSVSGDTKTSELGDEEPCIGNTVIGNTIIGNTVTVDAITLKDTMESERCGNTGTITPVDASTPLNALNESSSLEVPEYSKTNGWRLSNTSGINLSTASMDHLAKELEKMKVESQRHKYGRISGLLTKFVTTDIRMATVILKEIISHWDSQFISTKSRVDYLRRFDQTLKLVAHTTDLQENSELDPLINRVLDIIEASTESDSMIIRETAVEMRDQEVVKLFMNRRQ